jgi:NADPH2:quinone reductase
MPMTVPDRLSFAAAAAIPEVFVTAHEALIHPGKLASGGWALIHAAAGGVGFAKVMLAHALGAKTVFTVSGQKRFERVSELGGTVRVDYRKHDFLNAALDATDRRVVWGWDHGDDDGQGSLHSDRPRRRNYEGPQW